MNVDLQIKKWTLVWSLWSLMLVMGFAQTSISGKVTTSEPGEELIGANVIFYQNGVYVIGVTTDFDGNYHLEMEPGTYELEGTYVGFPPRKITGVVIKEGEETKLDFELFEPEFSIACGVSLPIGYRIPLIDLGNTSSKSTIDAQQIRRGSAKNIQGIISAAPGVSFGQ